MCVYRFLSVFVLILLMQPSLPLAAEFLQKAKLQGSGFFKSLVGFSRQSAAFEETTGTHYDAFNQINDSEIHFKATFPRDNGDKLLFSVEFNTDQTANGNNSNFVDNTSFLEYRSRWGLVYAGSTFGPIFKFGTQISPPGAVSMINCEPSRWIIRPNQVSSTFCGATLPPGNKNMKVAVSSNLIWDTFGVAAGYTPSFANTDAPPAVGGTGGTETQQYEALFVILPSIDAFALRADIGLWQNQGSQRDSHYGIRGGIDLAFGDYSLTFTTSRVKPNSKGQIGSSTSQEETSYAASATYSNDLLNLGISYVYNDQPRRSSIPGSDTIEKYGLGAALPISAGVELVGSLFYVKWQDEGGLSNKGAAMVTGINIGF